MFLHLKRMLESFIPYYVDLTQNDSQLILYGMAEFHKLQATKEIEPRVKPGEYYKHQLIVSRIMYNQDECFIIHEPGSGKSCTLVVTDEMFKDSAKVFKNYFMIIPSGLINSMTYQIICKCTDNVYINDKGRSGANKFDVQRSGKKSFKNNYTLLSYDDIFKEVKGKSKDQLQKQFSYSIFNFDEVTNLVNVKYINVTKKNNSKSVITWVEKPITDILMLKDIKDMDDPRIINSNLPYIQIWRLFHSINVSKKIIASGTPSINRGIETFILCNLLLPLDRQMDLELFGANIFYYNLKKFAPYLNGIITYVKSSSVVARSNYIGNKLNYKYTVEYPLDDTSDDPQIGTKVYDSQVIVYKVELFGYQARKLYNRKNEIVSEQISPETSQCLCYVDLLERTGSKANNDETTLNLLSQPGINGLTVRMNSSAIFSEIYRIEYDAYMEAKRQGKPGPGVCFNYLRLTETGIGSLKKIFTSGIFELMDDFTFLKQAGGDFCNIGTVTFKGIKKRPRMIFLTGSEDDSNTKLREMILQFAGSPDNMYGEYIQFIDGSGVMGFGYSVKHVKRFIRVLPEWNESNNKQSEDRVKREDSHDDIRNAMADEIALKTGKRPNPYSLDVSIDMYNICAFCRIYYSDISNVSKFLPSMKIDKNCPFLLDDTKRIVNEKMGEDQLITFDPMNVVYLIGFCEKDKGKELHHKQIMEYCKNGEVPHEKINEITGIEITTDLLNLTLPHMDIIISISGILFVSPYNEEVKKYLSNKVLIYYNDCRIMENYNSGFYKDVANAIVMKNKSSTNELELGEIPKPAILNEDYELISISMIYISPSEKQYSYVEEKSFGTRRVLRVSKRISVDCILNAERNYNRKAVDGSLECDYDTCEYTCSSNVLVGKSSDSFIYEGGGLFWSNYEVLYSDLIIKECKEIIISMIKQRDKITINEIFNRLMPICNREYFVNTAIYDLVSSRYKIINSFGADCYICANNTELFLTGDFPRTILNSSNNSGDYVRKLIAISNNPDYRKMHSVDDNIIEEIEAINIPKTTQNYDDVMISIIIEKTSKFKTFPQSSLKLIERAFGRIAYDRSVNPEFKNHNYDIKPVDFFIAQNIYSIRCFSIQDKNGNKIFFHNQPEISTMAKQAEISKILKATDPFRIFYLNNNQPQWRNATEEERVTLQKEAIKDIANRIEFQTTKNISLSDQNGQLSSYTFVSSYYVSYYNGTYRLVNKLKGTGEQFETLDNTDIIPCLDWLKKSLLLYIPNNYQKLMAIELAINMNKKRERNDLMISFFRDNDLIFYFTTEKQNDKKKK